MIQYRTYLPGDEQVIVELWNSCLETDPTTPKRFRRLVLLDANFDPEGLQLAFDGERLVGVLYGLRRKLPMLGTDLEDDNGWITFFFVDEVYRQKGVGAQLMKNADAFFKKHQRKSVFFASYAPNYIVPGIDKNYYPEGFPFLESQGFSTVYPCVAMDRNLVDFKISDDVKQLVKQRELEGYIFRRAEDRDLYDVIQFANDIFNPDWGRAISII